MDLNFYEFNEKTNNFNQEQPQNIAFARNNNSKAGDNIQDLQGQIQQYLEEIEKENKVPQQIINDDITINKKYNMKKIIKQNIDISEVQNQDKTIFDGEQTQVKLNLSCLTIKKYFDSETEYLNEIKILKHICSKGMNITLPLIDNGKAEEEKGKVRYYIEQQAGSKNLYMFKESFNQNMCFWNNFYHKCKHCQITDEYVTYLFIQLFHKLNLLHQIDIAHSDIKPQNIVFGYDNLIYFIDFGCSVELNDRENYLQNFTINFNLKKKYFQEINELRRKKKEINEPRKKKYKMNFNFKNNNQIKQCDRSQLAISWLYMSFRTVEEKKFFYDQDFNNLLKSIFKRNNKNKLIYFISRILNEADSDIQVLNEVNNIEKVFMNKINQNEHKNYDNNFENNQQQSIKQLEKIVNNIYFDSTNNLEIVNYQKDITYEENKFNIRRINEYSVKIVIILNNFLTNKIINFKEIQIKPLKSNDYHKFCSIYNIDDETYFQQLNYLDDDKKKNQNQSFLQYLNVAKNKIFELNLNCHYIEEFRNLMEQLSQKQKDRQSLKIYINFKDAQCIKIIKIHQIIEGQFPYEDMQLISINQNQDMQSSCINLKFILTKQNNQEHINKNKQQITKLAKLSNPDLLGLEMQLQIYQSHLEKELKELQKEKQEDIKNKIVIKQKRLKQVKEILKQKNIYKIFQEKKELINNLSNMNKHLIKLFEDQDEENYSFLEINKKQYQLIIEKMKQQKNISINQVNENLLIKKNTLSKQFTIAQPFNLIWFDSDLIISQMKLIDCMQKIQKALKFLEKDEFCQFDIVLNNFAFEDTSFWVFVKNNLNLYKQVQFKIRLIDCFFKKYVLTELQQLSQIIEDLQCGYEEYDESNQEYNQIRIKGFSYTLKMNQQNQETNNCSLIINLLCQPKESREQDTVKNQPKQVNEQNHYIKQEQEIGKIFQIEKNLDFDGNNKIQIQTENELKNIKGDISIQQMLQINDDLDKGILYDNIDVEINQKASIKNKYKESNEIKVFDSQDNLELMNYLFRFAFLTNQEFRLDIYIEQNKHIQISLTFTHQVLKFGFISCTDEQVSNKKDQFKQIIPKTANQNQSKQEKFICEDKEYLQIITQLLNNFEINFNKNELPVIECNFEYVICKSKYFGNYFQLIESQFQNAQSRRYYFENTQFTDEFLQILITCLKQNIQGILAIEFVDTNFTLSGLINFIVDLLCIGTEIGIVIIIDNMDDYKIFEFLQSYFQKYTKYIKNNGYTQIVLFPKSPKVFLEFCFDQTFCFENCENIIQHDQMQINKLQRIYGETPYECLLQYPYFDTILFDI